MFGKVAVEPGQGGGGVFGREALGLEQDAEITEAAGLGKVSEVSAPGAVIIGRRSESIPQGIGRQAVGTSRQGDPTAAAFAERWCVAAEGLQAEALEEPALGHVADGGQAGGLASHLGGGEIDLGGDVLASDVVQRRIGLAVGAVGYEGSVGAQRRVVEVAGGAAVVDGQRESRFEERGGGI